MMHHILDEVGVFGIKQKLEIKSRNNSRHLIIVLGILGIHRRTKNFDSLVCSQNLSRIVALRMVQRMTLWVQIIAGFSFVSIEACVVSFESGCPSSIVLLCVILILNHES